MEKEARSSGDVRSVVRLSGRFHILLAELSGNTQFVYAMQQLATLTCLIIALYDKPMVPHCFCDEHEAIVMALARNDAASAISLIIEHLNHVEDGFNAIMSRPADGSLENILE